MLNTIDINKLTKTAVDQTKSAIETASKQAEDVRSKFDSMIKESFDSAKSDFENFDLANPFASLPTPNFPEMMETITGYTLVTRDELTSLESRLAKAEEALTTKKAPAKRTSARKTTARKTTARKTTAKKATARKTASK